MLRVRERDGRAAGSADLVFGLLTSRPPDAAARLLTAAGVEPDGALARLRELP